MDKKKLAGLGVVLSVFLSCTDHKQDGAFDTAGSNWNPPQLGKLSDVDLTLGKDMKVCAQGKDANGTSLQYFWQVKGSRIDTTDTSCYSLGLDEPGPYLVYVKVSDADGLQTGWDSMTVTVHRYEPVLNISVADSVVKQGSKIAVNFSARDTNGSVTSFRWGFSPSNLSDSSTDSSVSVGYSSGGKVKLYARAIDNDGNESPLDSVSLLFDRPISVVSRVSPAVSTTNVDVTQGMSIRFWKWNCIFRWQAEDPDNDFSGVQYKLYLDTKENPDSLVYEGISTADTMQLDTGKTYFWKVVATDRMGNIVTSPTYQLFSRPIKIPYVKLNRVEALNEHQVSLSWSASPYAQRYIINRSLVGSLGSVAVDTITTTSFIDSTVDDTTSYKYSIHGEGVDGGMISNSLEVTTPGFTDLRVTSVIVSPQSDAVSSELEICTRFNFLSPSTVTRRTYYVIVGLENVGSRKIGYFPVNTCYAANQTSGVCDDVQGGSVEVLQPGETKRVVVPYSLSSDDSQIGNSYYFKGWVPNSAISEDKNTENNVGFTGLFTFTRSADCNIFN